MPPKTARPSSGDLFRMLLVNIIDQKHELVRLARLIDWARFDAAFGGFYNDQKGREGLPTRFPLGGASLACRAMDGRTALVETHEGALG
jgi:IS5 family transposase